MGTPTYHLFVDDSGSRFIDHPSTPRHDGLDHFAMGGLLIKAEDVDGASEGLKALRARHAITAPFHSTKIRSRKKEWAWLGVDVNRANSLLTDLGDFLCSIPGFATACVVHRPGYETRYSTYAAHERWQLCKSAYAILVERAAKIAVRDGRKLAVYVEQTGPKEDRDIRGYHRHLRGEGMIFNPETSGKYAPLEAASFAASLLENPNFFDKSSLMGQVADLLLYPLVKGRYDPSYRPFCDLKAAGRIIDSTLVPEEENLGVKYYCFDEL
ncbi:DUF3800 domain-containing protein [Acidisoma cellulosilytica]|uniref:DUF3800 domain-containing protein n=1 Tax=Acidisoma cellulosilyticum TaxID=2802395 RepID=A0A963Z8I1_9PROT|nr:DUF3800 domain-containing protein [Acidisoma cellulosilyticum]MCB8884030.1 DUF3800 domain-containing protein [Acidisoma cellulosilyticum]